MGLDAPKGYTPKIYPFGLLSQRKRSMDKKTKSLRLIKASKSSKFFSKYDIKKCWKYFISFIQFWLLNQQNEEGHIGVYRIGDAIVDLYENNSGYYGTIFVDNYIWEFNGLKDSAIGIHNEIAEIADAILRASWWAEEVIELEELPDWCSYLKYAMF
ncbi:MAG: hypothetical protein ACFFDH_13540 [Promethearchaeota archaeon]